MAELASTGKVAQGALDLLSDLPTQHAAVDGLRALLADPSMCFDIHNSEITNSFCGMRHGLMQGENLFLCL